MEPITQNKFRGRSRTATPATSSTSAQILRSDGSPVQSEFKSSIRIKIECTITSVNAVNEVKPKKRTTTPGPELQDSKDKINSDVIYISTHSIPKAEPCSPFKRTCKPKVEPYPPKQACKQPRDSNASATPFEPQNRCQSRTNISTPAAVALAWSRIFRSKENQVAGPSARAVPPTSTAIVIYDERKVPPFSSSPFPTSSDSGRQRERQVPRQGFGKRKQMHIKYTHNEGQKILDYICRNHLHPYTGGNQIWRDMSLDKVTAHPEQSMKEHFRKQVYPRMFTSYRCSSPDRKRFELAEREVSRGRRIPKYTRTSRVYPPR